MKEPTLGINHSAAASVTTIAQAKVIWKGMKEPTLLIQLQAPGNRNCNNLNFKLTLYLTWLILESWKLTCESDFNEAFNYLVFIHCRQNNRTSQNLCNSIHRLLTLAPRSGCASWNPPELVSCQAVLRLLLGVALSSQCWSRTRTGRLERRARSEVAPPWRPGLRGRDQPQPSVGCKRNSYKWVK